MCVWGGGEWAKGLGRGDLFSKLTLLNLIEIDVEKCWIKIKWQSQTKNDKGQTRTQGKQTNEQTKTLKRNTGRNDRKVIKWNSWKNIWLSQKQTSNLTGKATWQCWRQTCPQDYSGVVNSTACWPGGCLAVLDLNLSTLICQVALGKLGKGLWGFQ